MIIRFVNVYRHTRTMCNDNIIVKSVIDKEKKEKKRKLEIYKTYVAEHWYVA